MRAKKEMNHIGNIIRIYRDRLGMSRASLSENICSEKYVYLIEKGERTPSVEIARLFSDKLGVDLFGYYQYLDCTNPIEVREKIKSFNLYRRTSDYHALKKVTDTAVDLPDFHREPWAYEIEVNRFAYLIFIEKAYEEAIAGINAALQKLKPRYAKGIYVANLYMLLSMCYQLTGDSANARNVTLSANEIIRNKHSLKDYEEIIITVGVGTLAMHYMSGEFSEVIQKANELLRYKNEVNSFERIDYIYFYLAFAYYQSGSHEEAYTWFKKAIYSVMFLYDPVTVYYMAAQDLFDVLLRNARINPDLISEFKERYKIDAI